jgi:tripartite-type tricarboxylate transporter receptor subunit TctC
VGKLSHRVRLLHPRAILAGALLVVLTNLAFADDVENFYRGRTLSVVISYSVGGGYDLYARVLTRYLGKHIPGRPSVVPVNMPGAGGLRASNYLYTAAPKDGSVIGTFSRSIPTMPLLTPTASFDGREFAWIKVAHPQWGKDKSVNFLMQAALTKEPELPDVPLSLDLIDDPEKKQILYLHFAPQAMGRPFAAPPGIPKDRKAALIRAFDVTLKDPELLAETARQKMDIAPMSGHEIDVLLRQLYEIPADVVAKAAKAIAD